MKTLEAFANVAQSQTDTVLVAGIAGKIIRVVSAELSAGATATGITFNTKGAGAGTAISPLLTLAVNTPHNIPQNSVGWWETLPGQALTVSTGAGSTVGVSVTCEVH